MGRMVGSLKVGRPIKKLIGSPGSFGGSDGAPGLSLPAGALFVHNASDYIAATKTIPNSAVNAARDLCITKAPRRLFNRGGWWGGHSLVTVTDANTTAPDGTNDATTVTAAGSTAWFMQGQLTKLGIAVTVSQTYTIAISVRSLSGGNLDFALGNANGTAIRTATPSWGRFVYTFSALSPTTTWLFKSPDGVQLANFAICDWQVFQGGLDLNTGWNTQAPQSYLNADLILDRDTSTVTSGAFTKGSHGTIHVASGSAVTPNAFTFIYVAKFIGVGTNNQYDPIIAALELAPISYNSFSIGPDINNSIGINLNTTALDKTPPGGNPNTCPVPHTWGGCGGGPYVGAHRYTGTQASAFINGVKLLDHASTATAVALTDFGIGYLFNTFGGGNNIYFVAYWPRALSDKEIRDAYTFISGKVTLGVPRTVLTVGTSISVNANTYALQMGAFYNPAAYGATWGVGGHNLDQLVTDAATFGLDALMTGAPSQRFILSVEIGANDLGTTGHYAGNVAGFLTTLAAYCDARRSAGWKINLHTILARLDQADGGVQFNLDRATANTTIKTWVGTHIDAYADWAADATMGTDTAPNNATNWSGDKIHPIAAGFAILAPISAAAVNTIV